MEEQAVRYPKRKREQVSYFDSGVDSEEEYGEDMEEQGHLMKKVKVSLPKKPKPLPKKKMFPFMDLPAELRNKIYEYALHDPHGHYIIAERRSNRRVGSRVALNTFKGTSQGRNDKWRRRQTLFANLSDQEIQEGWKKVTLRAVLLRLNKTVYNEAVGYLYNSKFVFADTNALHDFVTTIGPRMRARLRDIEVADWGYSSAHKAMNYPAMCALADAVNLERIWLNICHSENTLAQKVFRDCCTFLLAYGSVNGRKKDAACDIIVLPSSTDERRPWQLQVPNRAPATNQKVLEYVRDYVNAA